MLSTALGVTGPVDDYIIDALAGDARITNLGTTATAPADSHVWDCAATALPLPRRRDAIVMGNESTQKIGDDQIC